jgi:ABC-type polysaccharide/polyol phosphate transport system ATPase subunit
MRSREHAYVVRDLGVQYNLAIARPRTLKSLARDFAHGNFRATLKRPHWAIRHLDFEVERGETLGVVGANGSGKSTLLLALSGVLPPDEGIVHTTGWASLLTLGAGFQIDLTGRQNIFLNAAYLGLSRKQTAGLLDEIVDFSELEDFIDVPLSQYSAGMRARLGFAVATHTSPDILLLDEVLSVGDLHFREKAHLKMLDVMEDAGAIVIVSHDLAFLYTLCSRVAWLDHGALVAIGSPDEVLERYRESLTEQQPVVARPA